MFRFVNAPALVTLTLVTLVLTHSSPPAFAATEEWLQVGEDIVGTGSSTNAGKAVAISRDGLSVAVSSWEIDNTGPGSVRVYELNSAGGGGFNEVCRLRVTPREIISEWTSP